MDTVFVLSKGTSESRGHSSPRRPRRRTGGRHRARAGGDGAHHACPRRRCRGAGGRSAASAREESSRLISGCLADAKCVSGQQEEGRGSESSGSRRRSSPPARSVSACAPASAGGRGWARDSRTTHAAAAPGRAAESPAPLQGARVARAVFAGNPRRPCRCPYDPGQVRKVSWAGAAPRLTDLSATGEGAGAGARSRRPAPGDSGRLGDTFVSSLGAPRLRQGWPRRSAGWRLCGSAGALRIWGSLGRGWEGWSGSRGSGPRRWRAGPGAREPAQTFRPGPAGGRRRRAAPLASGDWGPGECGIGGSATPEAARRKGLEARTPRRFPDAGRCEGIPPASACLGGGGDGLQ